MLENNIRNFLKLWNVKKKLDNFEKNNWKI